MGKITTGIIITATLAVICDGYLGRHPEVFVKVAAPFLSEQTLARYKLDQHEQDFYDILTRYMPEIEYSLPKNPRALEVGCGIHPVGRPLDIYFGLSRNGGEYVGTDIEFIDETETDMIETVRKSYGFNGASYKVMDGRELSDHFLDEFDIVAVRNPEVKALEDVWTEIYGEIKDVLKDKGILINTAYKDEKEKMTAILENAGYQIIVNEKNPFARKPMSRDRYVLIAITSH